MTGRNWVRRADGAVVELGACDRIRNAFRDCFVIETPRGGGYGGPAGWCPFGRRLAYNRDR